MIAATLAPVAIVLLGTVLGACLLFIFDRDDGRP